MDSPIGIRNIRLRCRNTRRQTTDPRYLLLIPDGVGYKQDDQHYDDHADGPAMGHEEVPYLSSTMIYLWRAWHTAVGNEEDYGQKYDYNEDGPQPRSLVCRVQHRLHHTLLKHTSRAKTPCDSNSGPLLCYCYLQRLCRWSRMVTTVLQWPQPICGIGCVIQWGWWSHCHSIEHF